MTDLLGMKEHYKAEVEKQEAEIKWLSNVILYAHESMRVHDNQGAWVILDTEMKRIKGGDDGAR